MSQYTRGRIAANNGSLTITGADTLWYENIKAGDLFKPKNISIYGTVAVVVSNTELTLNSVWLGSNVINSEYQITRDFTAAFGFYEINPGDVNWAYYITQNLRKIDNLFDIMSAGVISEEIIAARDAAVTAVGNVDLSVAAAAGSATAAAGSATAAAGSATAAGESATAAEESATESVDASLSATTSASGAAASALQAKISTGAFNYCGAWIDLVGPLEIPSCVFHAGEFWNLIENLVDVTLRTPGASTSWEALSKDFFNRVIGSSGELVYPSVASVIADTGLMLGDTIKTTAYYADSIGGGAEYKVVDADTGIEDLFLYFDLSNGLQIELIIKDGTYKAKQAGVKTVLGINDSTDIIRAMSVIPQNSVFVFDPGFTYNVSNVAVTLPGVNTIIASGAKFNCTTDGTAFDLNASKLSNILSIKWKSGIFSNSASTRLLSQAINAEMCQDIKIEDALFNQFHEAVNCVGSVSVSVEKNFFSGNTKDITLDTCSSTDISKNTFSTQDSDGVTITNCSGTSIQDNSFAQTTVEGGSPIVIDEDSTKTDIGINTYDTAPVSYACPRHEITCWPGHVSGVDVTPVTGYDGVALSTGSATIDMSAAIASIFPTHITPRGYELIIKARDSGSSSSSAPIVEVSRNSSSNNKLSLRIGGFGLENDLTVSQSGYVAADENGDILINYVSSGADTLDVWVGVSLIQL